MALVGTPPPPLRAVSRATGPSRPPPRRHCYGIAWRTRLGYCVSQPSRLTMPSRVDVRVSSALSREAWLVALWPFAGDTVTVISPTCWTLPDCGLWIPAERHQTVTPKRRSHRSSTEWSCCETTSSHSRSPALMSRAVGWTPQAHTNMLKAPTAPIRRISMLVESPLCRSAKRPALSRGGSDSHQPPSAATADCAAMENQAVTAQCRDGLRLTGRFPRTPRCRLKLSRRRSFGSRTTTIRKTVTVQNPIWASQGGFRSSSRSRRSCLAGFPRRSWRRDRPKTRTTDTFRLGHTTWRRFCPSGRRWRCE